eukprot:2094938-Alexandrium_andersonii.AAC.1
MPGSFFAAGRAVKGTLIGTEQLHCAIRGVAAMTTVAVAVQIATRGTESGSDRRKPGGSRGNFPEEAASYW